MNAIPAAAGLRAPGGDGPKHPACFLVRFGARRFLLDCGAGAGSEPAMPDLSGLDAPPEAILLSHQHPDHIGALHLWDRLGRPPVYATGAVARAVEARFPITCRLLPYRGTVDFDGIRLTTGGSGHAPGGVWLHLAGPGAQLLYMGDHSVESLLYPYDAPPAAETLILDASYDLDDGAQEDRRLAILARMADGPALLPLPAEGRGLEILLLAARLGLPLPAICERLRESGTALAADEALPLRPGCREELMRVLAAAPDAVPGRDCPVLLADPHLERAENAALLDTWLNSARPILLTGHVAPGTRSWQLRQQGRAEWLRWNVHPRFSDNLALVGAVGARAVLPAFGHPRHRADWRQALGDIRMLQPGPDAEVALS